MSLALALSRTAIISFAICMLTASLYADSFTIATAQTLFFGATNQSFTAAPAHVSFSVNNGSTVTPVSGTAMASASFGQLHSYSQSVTGLGTSFGSFGVNETLASASFYDVIHVSGANAPGYIALNVAVDGFTTLVATGPSPMVGAVFSSYIAGNNSIFLSNGTGHYTFLFPYSFQTHWAANIQLTLGTTVACFGGFNYRNQCIATNDFSNTASVTQLQIEDASFNLIPGASYIADSGTVYGGSPVPEPGSLLLMFTGMAGVITMRSRFAFST